MIVITGASSGIGLATALSASKAGAKIVLVSRNEASLAEVKRKIEDMGGEAIYVVADVADKDGVKNIIRVVEKNYGGFDTWVNCAGVSIFGMLEEVTDEDSRRLFETNYWGTVYGSLAAAEHLKTKGGAIINLGSLLSDMSVPLQGMYSASKHAVKGFTEALRIELEAKKSNVSVTLVKPAAIATPFFSHAKNYMIQEAKAPPPVYAPEEVAYAILTAAQKPVRDVRVGGSGVLMAAMNAHAPRLMDWLNANIMLKSQMGDDIQSRHKNNLHSSGNDGFVRGQNMGKPMTSVYTRASLHPVVSSVAIAAIGVAAFALLGNKRHVKIGKSAFAGMKYLLPLQNAILASSIAKSLERSAHQATKSVSASVLQGSKAVNENAKLVKKKTIALWK